MADEENKDQATGAADTGAENTDAGEAKEGEGEGDKDGEDASTQPAADEILRDPRTGEPLRDQTRPAADTGYLGKHDMQDKTESAGVGPNGPDESDFEE